MLSSGARGARPLLIRRTVTRAGPGVPTRRASADRDACDHLTVHRATDGCGSTSARSEPSQHTLSKTAPIYRKQRAKAGGTVSIAAKGLSTKAPSHGPRSAPPVHRALEHSDKRQVTVAFGIVEPIPHDELARNIESDIADRY